MPTIFVPFEITRFCKNRLALATFVSYPQMYGFNVLSQIFLEFTMVLTLVTFVIYPQVLSINVFFQTGPNFTLVLTLVTLMRR